MASVTWSDEALDQLYQITAYIRVFDPVAAAHMSAQLWKLGESLATFPNRGRPTVDGKRELVTVRPYVLTYSVDDDVVDIRGVRHSARRSLDPRR